MGCAQAVASNAKFDQQPGIGPVRRASFTQRLRTAKDQKLRLDFAIKNNWEDVAVQLRQSGETCCERMLLVACEKGMLEFVKLAGNAGGLNRIGAQTTISSPQALGQRAGGNEEAEGSEPEDRVKLALAFLNAGEGALYYAASCKNKATGYEITKYLIAQGCSLDQRHGKWKRPALSWACRQGNWGPARALLEAGADVNLADEYGFSALDHASGGSRRSADDQGDPETVRLLLQHGAVINESALRAEGDICSILIEAQKKQGMATSAATQETKSSV